MTRTLLQLLPLIAVATQAVVNGVEQVTGDREVAGAMVEDAVVVDKGMLFLT